MKKSLVLLALIIISVQAKAVDYYKGSYAEALQEAESSNKLVLLYFTAKWCGPCQYMGKYILTDDEVHHIITKDYIALKLDVDIEANKKIYYKYNADKGISIPKFFVINAKEEVIKSQSGSMKLNQFKKFLQISEMGKPISKAESDSIAQSRIKNNTPKPSLFNKFMYNCMNSRWKPGIRLGTNYHSLQASGSSTDYDKNKFGLNLGLFMSYESKHFLFQPGISYSRKGAKISDTDERVKLNYLEIPLRFSINTIRHRLAGSQSVRLNIEPYAAYALNGKWGNDDLKFGNSDQEINRFDYGLKTGISLELGSFEPSLGYDFGLKNLSNKDGEKIFNRGFYLNFALIFGN